MKIGVLSDLHIDTNAKTLAEGESFSDILSRQLILQEIDLLLLAGDISSDYRESQAFLEEVQQQSGKKILFVPGNHDYWSRTNGETNTRKIYEFFRNQPETVLEKPYLIGDEWAVVGNSGWYDYGYADTEMYNEEDFNQMKLRFGTWQDKRYCDWGMSNKEVADWMLHKIEKDIQSVGDRKIILMTHVVTHPSFVVPLPHRAYNYFNAFLGSSSYERLYEKYDIDYSIMGHVHFRKKLTEKGTHYLCACLGGRRHWRTKDPEAEIVRSMMTFQLN